MAVTVSQNHRGKAPQWLKVLWWSQGKWGFYSVKKPERHIQYIVRETKNGYIDRIDIEVWEMFYFAFQNFLSINPFVRVLKKRHVLPSKGTQQYQDVSFTTYLVFYS